MLLRDNKETKYTVTCNMYNYCKTKSNKKIISSVITLLTVTLTTQIQTQQVHAQVENCQEFRNVNGSYTCVTSPTMDQKCQKLSDEIDKAQPIVGNLTARYHSDLEQYKNDTSPSSGFTKLLNDERDRVNMLQTILDVKIEDYNNLCATTS
jgi:hypothetical protein